MYISLCRFKDSSLVRGLLDLAAKTASSVAIPMGPMVKTATDFAGSLMNIFGADGVETRFGRLDGNVLSNSGYRILAGSAEDRLNPKDLRVQEGQLVRKIDGQDTTIDDADYILIAFEHRSTLVDETFSLVENLQFHPHWLKVVDAIVRSKGAPEAADAEMMELRSAVLQSFQLTETDRLPLLQLYDVKREQLEASFSRRRNMKSQASDTLLNSLERSKSELDGGNASRLGVVGKVITDLITAKQAEEGVNKIVDSASMAKTFSEIAQAQRVQVLSAGSDEIAATARSYAAAAMRR
jgi:hypothetical protein